MNWLKLMKSLGTDTMRRAYEIFYSVRIFEWKSIFDLGCFGNSKYPIEETCFLERCRVIRECADMKVSEIKKGSLRDLNI